MTFYKYINRKNVPNGLVIGPMKCGTSWIQNYFSARGDVCLPDRVKEVFYFDLYHERGLCWYEGFFTNYDPTRHARIVEVAPSLFHAIDKIGIIRRELGDIPLLVTIRDPIERSWSHYQHLVRRGYTKKSLKEAIKDRPEIIEASLYEAQLALWRGHFSNVYVVQLNELRDNPIGYTESVCAAFDLQFNGIPERALGPRNEATNPTSLALSSFSRKITNKLRENGYYKIVNLAKSLGMKKIVFGGVRSEVKAPISDSDKYFLIKSIFGNDNTNV